MNKRKVILLSFDVEEFDMPLEYGQLMSIDDQLNKGYEGLVNIKQLLSFTNVPATLFTTANFANHFPGIIRDLSINHEIASHTFYHSFFKLAHLVESRTCLENITGKKITGLRMPRMKVLPARDIIDAGYSYDASINPIWLPGRYNNLGLSRKVFEEDSIMRIPASVSTFLRIPLFWLSFKNLSYSLYLKLVMRSLQAHGYVSLYFHPWEFTDLTKYKIPFYAKNPSGEILLKRLELLIRDLKAQAEFKTMNVFPLPRIGTSFKDD
ncbi:MAG TPA: polysaccharide deacetylase family protein [Chitinophagaceae bacterium]|nr:polysaccharide deacetylase family protein [Chitinophagaceae bacterium]